MLVHDLSRQIESITVNLRPYIRQIAMNMATANPDPVKLCNIGGTMELVLFQAIPRVGRYEELIFSAIAGDNSISTLELPHNDSILATKVVIEIHLRNAKTPHAMEKTIGGLISDAGRVS